jgi:HEAT repeat protein/archaellum component FlaF (FlaF/FlaG flagellin family)
MNRLLNKLIVCVCLIAITGAAFGADDDVFQVAAKYKDGQSRAAVIKLEQMVVAAAKDESKRADVEAKLIEFIDGDTTYAGKQFLCKQLGLIGSAASADLLAKLVVDETTSDMARYAAEHIPGAEIDTMLINAAYKTSGDVQIGIINTLGVRKTVAAVAPVAEMIKASDEKLSLAAIEALKRIGNAEAMSVLAKKKDLFKGTLHESVMDAYLYCVDGLLASGETKKAAKAYKRAYRLFESDPIRIAAVEGMLNSAGKKKVKVILDVLKGDDAVAKAVAISAVRELDPEAIKPILRKFKSLSETDKVQLITAISEMKTEAVLATVVKAASSDSQPLRLAAIKALAVVGDGDSVKLLAGIAANSKGNEQKAARASLYNMAAKETDAAIIACYGGADPGVKKELLKAIAERKIEKSKPIVLKGTKDADAKVRVEALRAVAVTQNLTLDELLDTLAIAASDAERSLAEKTIVLIIKAKKNTYADTKQIVGQMDDLKAKGVDVKAAALRVLGGIGNDAGYDTLVKAISSKDEKIQRAAIDGLTIWPGGKPLNILLATISTTTSKSNKVMAFRGYVEQIGNLNVNRAVSYYQRAIEAAENDSQKRSVLSAISQRPSVKTLEMAIAYIDDPKLKNEAAAAVSQIIDKIDAHLGKMSLPVLVRVKSKVSDAEVAKKIQDLINNLDRHSGIVSRWLVSGAYTSKKGKLIDEVFAPENPLKGDVKWKMVVSDKNGVVHLGRVIDGDNRAAYLTLNVVSDKAREVRFEIGSDDGVKVWVNGKVVHRNDTNRPCTPGQDKVNVNLRKGDNIVLMKIVQGAGNWSAHLRIRNTDSSRVDRITMKLSGTRRPGRRIHLIGSDLSNWRKPYGKWEVVGKAAKSGEDEKQLAAEKGTGLLYNGPVGKTSNLISVEEFGDVTAHIEFMVPKGSNSGVYFMGRYEIQVYDSYGVEENEYYDCGGIYRAIEGFEGKPARVNVCKEPGQLQSYDVVFKAPKFDENGKKISNAKFVEVIHNGIVIHENQEVSDPTASGISEEEKPTGPLMLQGDHGPVVYRNVYLIKN